MAALQPPDTGGTEKATKHLKSSAFRRRGGLTFRGLSARSGARVLLDLLLGGAFEQNKAGVLISSINEVRKASKPRVASSASGSRRTASSAIRLQKIT
jgi:hypothetical protein